MPIDPQLAQSIQQYTQLSEDHLLAELGRRVEEMEKDPFGAATRLATVAPPPPDTAALAGPIADKLKAIGKRFLAKFNQKLYNLMCNPNDPDNKEIRDAVSSGSQKAGLVLAGVLLANFAWLPGIVAVVASLVLKRFVDAAYDTACSVWADELK